MQGCITTRDVLRHPVIICRAFGVRCWLRCLQAAVSGRRCTFLEVAVIGVRHPGP